MRKDMAIIETWSLNIRANIYRLWKKFFCIVYIMKLYNCAMKTLTIQSVRGGERDEQNENTKKKLL